MILCVKITLCTNPESTLTWFHQFLIGSISGGAAMVPYAPFHYFQNRTIQNLPIHWHKPRHWFRGLPTLALGKMPTFGMQMATYNVSTRLLENEDQKMSEKQKIYAAMFAGASSGLVQNVTQHIALHQENDGRSLSQTIRSLHSNQVLLRALGTNMAIQTMFTHIYLNYLQNMKSNINTYTENKILAQLYTGLFSGCMVAVTTQPLMVISAKLYADIERKEYSNGFSAMVKIFLNDGIRGFYTGTGYRSLGIIVALPVLDYVAQKLQEKI